MEPIKIKINVFPASRNLLAMAQATIETITIKGIRVERTDNGIKAVLPSVDDGMGGEIAFVTMPDETHSNLLSAVVAEYSAALTRIRAQKPEKAENPSVMVPVPVPPAPVKQDEGSELYNSED